MLDKLFVLLGLFASQRYAMSGLYHFAPLFPLLVAVICLRKSRSQAGVYVMIALFFTSDLGGEMYNTTISSLREATYVAALWVLVLLTSPRLDNLAMVKLFALITLVLLTTMGNLADTTNAWSFSTAIRDTLILICLCVCLLDGKKERFDLLPMYYASLGYLAGELVNLAFFFERPVHFYMSFNSLKSFIVFPLFYRLIADKKLSSPSIAIATATSLVILAYNSKMFVLSLAFVSILVTVIVLCQKPSLIGRTLLGIVTLVLVSQATLFLFQDVEGNRIVAFFSLTDVHGGFLSAIEYLDPVRTHQHYLFFSRGLTDIIFGNGIGAGIHDVSGQLTYFANETAFSMRELQDARYFNFHDVWIDFGLRFGLITVLAISFSLIRILLNPSNRMMCIVFIVLLINATFSISGVLMATLFYKVILQQSTLDDWKLNATKTLPPFWVTWRKRRINSD